jgi:hypothetical protein
MPIVRKWTVRTEKDWMMDWGSRIASSLEALRLGEQISAVHRDTGRSANTPLFGYTPFRPLTRTPILPKTLFLYRHAVWSRSRRSTSLRNQANKSFAIKCHSITFSGPGACRQVLD